MKKLLKEPIFHFVLILIYIIMAHGLKNAKALPSSDTNNVYENKGQVRSDAGFKMDQKQ